MRLFLKTPIRKDVFGFAKVRKVLVLVTIAICAFFLAKGTTNLVAASFMAADDLRNVVSSQESERNTALPPGSDIPNPKDILKRNIFDSTTGPLWPPSQTSTIEDLLAKKEPVSIPGPDNPPPECKRDLSIVASAYFPKRPQRSIVALQGSKETDTQHLYKPGTEMGDTEIVSIYPNAAYLKGPSGDYCSLRLFTERNAEETSKKKRKAKKNRKRKNRSNKVKKSAKASAQEIKRGIKKLGENKYRIDRELADKALTNRLPTIRKVKARPYTKKGKLVGFKLYGIRRNGLFAQLGIRNGDLVRSINGYKITSIDSAIEAYSRLKNVNDLRVDIDRRNKNKTLELQIR